MSIKLKALGLGLLAAMAMGAFAVSNASAIVTGHFTSVEQDHVIVKAAETFGTQHRLKFQRTSPTGTANGNPLECDEATYEGTIPLATTTVQTVQITPTYAKCHTPGEAAGTIQVAVNGCTYTLSSRTQGTGHGTVSVDCPAGKAIIIQHPNCESTVTAQSHTVNPANGNTHMGGGLTYHTTTESGKHALTATVTVREITVEFHGKICTLLGTHHIFDMDGSLTVWGQNTDGVRTDITHT